MMKKSEPAEDTLQWKVWQVLAKVPGQVLNTKIISEESGLSEPSTRSSLANLRINYGLARSMEPGRWVLAEPGAMTNGTEPEPQEELEEKTPFSSKFKLVGKDRKGQLILENREGLWLAKKID